MLSAIARSSCSTWFDIDIVPMVEIEVTQMLKAIASMFFLACGFFTVNVLFKHIAGFDLELGATAAVAAIFGVVGHFLFGYIKQKKTNGLTTV